MRSWQTVQPAKLNFFFQEALEQLQRMNLAELQTRLIWTWCWPFCVTNY